MQIHFLYKTSAVITLLLIAAIIFFRCQLIFFYNTEIGGVEIYTIGLIQQLLHGIPMYNNPEEIPFRIVQLTPLYYKTVATLAFLFKVNSNEPQQTFIISRCFSMFCNFLTILTLYFIFIKHLIADKKVAIFLSLVFSVFLVELYASRPDSLYILFHFLAIYIFLEYQKKETWLNFVVLCLCCVLAFFSKQTGVLVGAIVGSIFLFEKKWYLFFQFCVVYLVLFGLILINLIGYEQFILFYKNNYLGLFCGLDFNFYLIPFKTVGLYYVAIWQFLSVYIFLQFAKSKIQIEKKLLIGIVLSTFFGMTTGLKGGATFNHWTELFFYTLLLLGIYIEKNKNFIDFSSKASLIPLVLSAIIFFTAFTKAASLFLNIYIKKSRISNISNYESQRKVANYIKNELQLKENEFVYTTFRDYLDLFLIKNTIFIHKDMIQFMLNAKTFQYPEIYPTITTKSVRYLVHSTTIPSEFQMDKTIFENTKLEKIITIDDTFEIYKILLK